MNTTNNNNSLLTLRHELEFLNHGGYRTPVGSRQPLFCMESSVQWRQPLFFEDSPSCPKKRYEQCFPQRDCVLMGFVPVEVRNEAVPCRHIPLNDTGQTIASLSDAHANEKQIEMALRNWLVKTIERLEETAGL